METKENDIRIIQKLSSDDHCEDAFRRARLRVGIACKSCGGTEHYWLPSKRSFQCKDCRFRTTLKSGTLLQGSKLPFTYWFKSVYFTQRYPRLSAYELQRLLGHKFYEPIWAMMKKVNGNFKDECDRDVASTSPDSLLNDIAEALSKVGSH